MSGVEVRASGVCSVTIMMMEVHLRYSCGRETDSGRERVRGKVRLHMWVDVPMWLELNGKAGQADYGAMAMQAMGDTNPLLKLGAG